MAALPCWSFLLLFFILHISILAVWRLVILLIFLDIFDSIEIILIIVEIFELIPSFFNGLFNAVKRICSFL